MFNKTHTIKSPWNIIKANKKTDARIEAINIILDKIPYNKKIDLKSEKIDFQFRFLVNSSTEILFFKSNSPILVLFNDVKVAPHFNSIPRSLANDLM